MLDKDEQESEVIKDSPDSPEPLNKKPRLSTEEVQPPERAKGNSIYYSVIDRLAAIQRSKLEQLNVLVFFFFANRDFYVCARNKNNQPKIEKLPFCFHWESFSFL